MSGPPPSPTSEGRALDHSCANTRLYVLQDVTVYVRLFKDGELGGIRDSKPALVREAHDSIHTGADVVCQGCGWMGRL